MMNDVTIARGLHVVFVVLWIGGVAFVTTVLLPTVRRLETPDQRIEFFERIERSFAWQARISTAAVGLTGLYMLYRFDMWDRFRHAAYWWIDAMVAVWLVFTLILFVVEPLKLHQRLVSRADPEILLKRVEWAHRILLLVSLITILGAVMGSHGLLLFG